MNRSTSPLAWLCAPRLLIGAAFVAALGASGCSVPQSDACATFIDCQAHYDETYGLTPTNTDAYGTDGLCWSNASRADDCTESCLIANEVLARSLRDTGNDPAPCE